MEFSLAEGDVENQKSQAGKLSLPRTLVYLAKCSFTELAGEALIRPRSKPRACAVTYLGGTGGGMPQLNCFLSPMLLSPMLLGKTRVC